MNAELESMLKAMLAGVALAVVFAGVRYLMWRGGWRPKPPRAPQPSRTSSVLFFLLFAAFSAGSFATGLPYGGVLFLIMAVLAPLQNESWCRKVARNRQWSAHLRRFAPHVISERLPGIPLSLVNNWQIGAASPPDWEQQILMEKLGEPPDRDNPVQ